MTNQKKWWLAFWSGAILVVTFAGWLLFAPPQLGGQATMVIVDGNSMEPGYHQGDLIIIRSTDVYQIGDIVAYKHLQMGKYVIHRIIGEELNRFILQGDNNSWTDGFQPTQADIIGKHWIQIPKLGKVIAWLRKPIYLSFTASLLGGVLMISWFKEKNKKWHRKPEKSFSVYQWINAEHLGKSGEVYFLTLGIFLIIAIIFGGIAYAKPVEKNIPQDFFYTHNGKFDYSAPAPEGVYDSATIQSGSPVFFKLTCDIQVDYQYTLTADSFSGINGSQSMTAVISDSTGWKRTIPLQTETAFQGNKANSQAIFNVCQAAEIVDGLREKTGLQRSEFSLAIMPTTKVNGMIGSSSLNDAFSPSLNFKFNDIGLWMVSSNTTGSEQTNPLTPSTQGMLRNWVETPETMAFLGLSLPVSGVRWGSSLIFLLSAGILGFLMYSIEKMSKSSQSTGIQLRYSPMIVDVQKQPPTLRRGDVEVQKFEDLARLAERNNSVILHKFDADGTHTYLVEEDNTIYRWKCVEPMLDLKMDQLMNVKAELVQSLEEGQFELYYQPMVDILQQQITGVEALLRWNHPELGTLPASAFVTDAEETGFIYQLGEWVLHTACKQLQEWDDAGTPTIAMAINISSKQLISELPRLIKRVIKEHKIKPHRIQLEFTEAQLVEDMDHSMVILDALKKIGVEISIDNYTGKASMANLARLKAKNLKFALAMLDHINDPQMNAITISSIAAARSLGMAIDAVGVETEEQLWFLRTHLVTSAQGYLLGRPISADETLQKLFSIDDKVVVYEAPQLEL
ncbi:MAG TPA: signal peptidase I [Anaerolineaceae bacterium]|nr:signal peptidase I [Anaerolineaceae bacterium]